VTGRSIAWSNGPVVEVPDVTKEEALRYLRFRQLEDEKATAFYKLSDEKADDIYKLVGGRMSNLKKAADETRDGYTFEGTYMALLFGKQI
jgi:hypothetical protein